MHLIELSLSQLSTHLYFTIINLFRNVYFFFKYSKILLGIFFLLYRSLKNETYIHFIEPGERPKTESTRDPLFLIGIKFQTDLSLSLCLSAYVMSANILVVAKRGTLEVETCALVEPNPLNYMPTI